MTDLTFKSHHYDKVRRTICALITPHTAKATAWLSEKMWFSPRWDAPVELDKPVTLSLDGAHEIEAMARKDGLQVEGL